MKIMSDIVTIITLIIVVAIIAVLISPNSRTAEVISAFTKSMTELLRAVVAPAKGSQQ